ncbi:unnamed protein product [Prorocentrum cordatum]|uniref:Uncharacterized protein n=1 Tax=Prorocentrum cordatum TaxID=2364126 RepID=A0ABN9SZY5_9DINO|nr:unnamed protein product [Polarella glacialis]
MSLAQVVRASNHGRHCSCLAGATASSALTCHLRGGLYKKGVHEDGWQPHGPEHNFILKGMNMTDVRVEKLEHLFEETGRNPNLANDALDTNIREYVQEYMANQPNYTHNAAQPDYAGTQHTHTDKRMLTTIIGNLDGLDDLVSATTWLQDKIEAMSGPRPSKVYAKGQYKGIIVAEFRDPGVRDLCVELLRRAGLKCGTKQVWASQDREPFDRAARSPCFGLKRLFRTEWSISDTVSVTEDLPYTITAGGEEAVTVHVESYIRKCEWHWELES